MRDISQSVGLAGEFLVAAHMAMRGWEVVHTSHGHPGYDLLGHLNGKPIGVRVKTGRNKTIQWASKGENLVANYDPTNKADFTALVLFDGEDIGASPIYILPTKVVVAAVAHDDSFYHQHKKKDGSTRKVTNYRVIRFFGQDRETNTAFGYDGKFKNYLGAWPLLEK